MRGGRQTLSCTPFLMGHCANPSTASRRTERGAVIAARRRKRRALRLSLNQRFELNLVALGLLGAAGAPRPLRVLFAV